MKNHRLLLRRSIRAKAGSGNTWKKYILEWEKIQLTLTILIPELI